MAGFLLDSTVLIDYLRGHSEVVAKLDVLLEEGQKLGICAINVAEVFAGMRDREREATGKWLSSLDWFDISYEVAQEAGEWRGRLRRSGKNADLTDVIIGCAARKNDAVLLTDNVKDFPLPGLQVERLPATRRR